MMELNRMLGLELALAEEDGPIPRALHHAETELVHTHCEAFRVRYVQRCTTLYQYTVFDGLEYRRMMASLCHSCGNSLSTDVNF